MRAPRSVAFAFLVVSRWPWIGEAEVAVATDGTCNADAGPGKACGPSTAVEVGEAVAYVYRSRAVDSLRSGASKHIAPWNLARPAWISEYPGLNRHQTPVVDDELNIYSGSDAGFIIAYRKNGTVFWHKKVGSAAAQNPAILNGVLYTATADGVAVAMNMTDGEEVWQTRVSDRLPGDTYSVTAVGDTVILPAGAAEPYGSPEVVALDLQNNGSIRWRYSIAAKLGRYDRFGTSVNLAPPVLDGSVIINDVTGGVYRLSLADGSEIWRRPGPSPDAYTLGGVAVGANKVVYNGFSVPGHRGIVQALDLRDGGVLWQQVFPQEIHAAPAVGVLTPGGPLTCVIATGEPPGHPETPWDQLGPFAKLLRTLGMGPKYNWVGTVYALSADTGSTLWTFTPPPWEKAASAGSTWEQLCLPDLWSGPTIGGDGTVYVNFSASGVTYALRDANGDGVVDAGDPREVASYDAMSGATGPPAVGPGLLTVSTCRKLITWLT